MHSRIEQLITEFTELEKVYGIPRSACLLECLKIANQDNGINDKLKAELQKRLGITRAHIEGVLTFYDMFAVNGGATGRESEYLYHYFLGDGKNAEEIRRRDVLLEHAGPGSHTLADYRLHGGYAALKKALALSPENILLEIKSSGLRGRGGAWFPVWLKWDLARKEPAQPKFLVANADEGEPPTRKDKVLLEHMPHLLIESMLIAAKTVGASFGAIYLRGDYTLAHQRLTDAIAEATTAGFLGPDALGPGGQFTIRIFDGGGSYVAGADTAQLQSIMGFRACSQSVPPFPTQKGLAGKPTVVNNVETLCCVPGIINQGGKWFSGIGSPSSPGTKIFGLCGAIRQPGIYELPTGITLRQLIEEYGGGVAGTFKAVIPGGITSGLVTNLDTALAVEGMRNAGASIGSGAVAVISRDTDMADLCRHFLRFYGQEACGNCLPCPLGIREAIVILDRLVAGTASKGDTELLLSISASLPKIARCGLGQSALLPLANAIRLFPEEFYGKEN